MGALGRRFFEIKLNIVDVALLLILGILFIPLFEVEDIIQLSLLITRVLILVMDFIYHGKKHYDIMRAADKRIEFLSDGVDAPYSFLANADKKYGGNAFMSTFE